MSTQAPRPPENPAEHAEESDGDLAAPAEPVAETPAVPNPYGEPGRPFTRNPFTFGLLAGLGLTVAYLLFLGLQAAGGVLISILVAGFLAIGINPIVVRVQRLVKRRGLAVAIVAFGMAVVFCGGLALLLPAVIEQVTAFINALPGYIEGLKGNRWINDLNNEYQLIERLKSAASAENITSAAGGLFSVLGQVFGTAFNAIMVVILTLYFLVSFDKLKAGAYALLPASRRPRAQVLGDEILVKVGNYTIGALGIGAIAGVTSLIFMIIAGIPYAYALALIVAVFDLIPQIGATLGAVIVSLVGFSQSIAVGIACVIFFVLYQQVENWLIYPRMMSRSVKVSDLGAILGLLIGAALFGIVGALVAVPAVAAIQLLVREVHIRRQDLA
ncbi:AI-2E family transporter [Actinorhabdospora filicis]|uniref:AI-2E family transporter n=1 Tax=Actinorhabdospora filicis TaxID=1785913 RepID=A0A9W6W7E4_9ACTN|nr:AI-2E family transporter [Actinorhabdospora filicis]GLZ75863.1 AI-2E family transporter [Actinorhabdospora filicis]